LNFEIYHPKNNVHNQQSNHDDNKVWITIFFFELTDNDGQNFLAGIVQLQAKKVGHQICVSFEKFDVVQALLSFLLTLLQLTV
jgi:hypothetical protein